MTEQELKAWAEEHAKVGSAVAKAVLALFGRLADRDLRCGGGVHVFGGGQWRCNCGVHTRSDFGVGEGEELPSKTYEAKKLGEDEVREIVNSTLHELGRASLRAVVPGRAPEVIDSPFEGSTGTPESGKAGRIMESLH